MNKTRNIPGAVCLLALAACAPAANDNRVVGELVSDRLELTAEMAEAIIEIAVPEGAAVKAGQLLLRQNDDRARAVLAEAMAQLSQTQARLAELVRGPRSEQISAARASVAGAQKEREFRSAEYRRSRDIHDRGLASAEALDSAKAALDAASADLDLRRAQLQEVLAGTTIEELAQAEAAVRQAEANRNMAEINLGRHTLMAPTDGIMDSRLFEVGERPASGQVVLVMLGGQQPHARVYVPERLRVLIKPGTTARIHVDGLATPLDGRVRWVASESAYTPYYALTERDRGRLSFLAKVDITERRDRLPDGVPLEVEFLVDDPGR
jgi:HlyD family secretion protein